MLDIGWSEVLLILIIAVLVIGPKDVPKIMFTFGRMIRRLQYARFAMTRQFDEILRAGDIDELRKSVNFEAPKTDERAADEDGEEQPPKPAQRP
jgi:sec-independent protein translocase protein TatB